ncbi:rhox homeobox family member 1-like [Sciurus carolinensis]|uniref:rhox homeobox family member 1-like n=1 Tax=Sciurus carolinensis TaxID=30640 RepID=UPI001FB4AEC3|nr:rhox homeobox family member 1-like [Sciurus carolinensis]
MDRPQECGREDASNQSLGIDKKPTDSSVIAVGGDDHGQKIRPEPEQGAAAEGCDAGAGALGPVNDNENQKGGGGDEKPRLQELKEPGHEAAEGFQAGDEEHGDFCNKFSQLQLQELERVFQRTQYPDVFARKKLAIPLSATEGKVELDKPEKNNLP